MVNNFSDITTHVMGNTKFIDDISCDDVLHISLFLSKVSKGIIKKLDITKAKKSCGVKAILTHIDIPGINQIGHIIKDQPLLVENLIEYYNQPIAIIVADTKKNAQNASDLIEIDVKELKPIITAREAFQQNSFIQQSRKMIKGDVDVIWNKCKIIVEDQIECSAQEHFYLETQSTLVIPKDDGGIKIYTSSQNPTAIQKDISEVIKLPMNKIEVDIAKIGGGFGGKEASAMYAAFPAVVVRLLNKPAKLVLSRNEDIAITGKRHPFSIDFKLGLDNDNKILAYQVKYFQDAGAFADISGPVLERCMLHAINSYNIPNVLINAYSCKTNKIPNTAFRGFGVPQAVFAIESAIYKAAEVAKIHPSIIQQQNLLKNNDIFHYGMKVEKCNAKKCWNILNRKYNLSKMINDVNKFNLEHKFLVKGIYIMPVCFGISFTQNILNQAGALVHLYTDGTVSISTGAIEMGQNVNIKIKLIAAKTLFIDYKKIKIETTNTSRVANASPTAASTGCDLNGMATKKACEQLINRLKKVVAEHVSLKYEQISISNGIFYFDNKYTTNINFKMAINLAYEKRIDLTCHAFYATPNLYFDRKKEIGNPFPYHSYGTSITEVTINGMNGTYKVDSVYVIHDIGESININIDKGQFEGGIVQGIGWSTIENIIFNSNGQLLSSASSYKIPDIKFVPDKFEIEFPTEFKNLYAVYNSKATGEPPFIHGLGTYFALLNALRNYKQNKKLQFSLPLTPEKVFMYIHK